MRVIAGEFKGRRLHTARGTRTRPAAERGNDLETTVSLSFEQAIDGAQVPVSVAANVCNVAVNVLARGKSSGEGCTATSGSEALAKVIRQRMKKAG